MIVACLVFFFFFFLIYGDTHFENEKRTKYFRKLLDL